MNQPAVKKHGGDQAKGLAVNDGGCPQRAEAVEHFAVESKQEAQAAAFSGLQCGDNADAKNQNIGDQ